MLYFSRSKPDLADDIPAMDLEDATHSIPNLAAVIPAMDLINEKLTTYSLNCKYSPTIRTAIGLTKRTLNRYYQLTDSSEVYRVAMGKCSIA